MAPVGLGATVLVVATGCSAPAPQPLAPPPALPAAVVRVDVAAQNPAGIAVSPDRRHVYVVDTDAGLLRVLDAVTGTQTATITTPSIPLRIALTPDGGRAYVTHYGDDGQPGQDVAVYDLTSNQLTALVPVPDRPSGITVSRDGRRVYVTNVGNGQTPDRRLTAIDTSTNEVAGSSALPPGSFPGQPAVDPEGRYVYVPVSTDDGPPLLVGVEAQSMTPAVALPTPASDPYTAVVAPDGGNIFVTETGGTSSDGGVGVLPPGTRGITPLTTTTGPMHPFGAALTPGGQLVVTDYGTDSARGTTVFVIDTATGAVLDRITLAGAPYDVAVTGDGQFAWVTTKTPAPGIWRIPLTHQ